MLKPVTDAAEIGLALIGADRRIVLWNAWIARASGIPAADAEGRRIAEIFPMLAGSRIEEAIAQALDGGLSALLTTALNKTLFPLRRPAPTPGKTEPMQQVVVVRPIGGEPASPCLVQVFDVTPMANREAVLRRQALTMEALAENYRLSELHSRAIITNTADAIVAFGEDGLISTYNPAAAGIFGFTPAEIVGRSITVLIPDLGGAGGIPHPSPFLDRRTEVGGVVKGGGRLHLELALSAVELGGTALYIAIARDVTDRKAAEEELRTQKEWLSTLINAMPDIVCFKDGAGRWLIVNQFYRELLNGGPGPECIGRTATEMAALLPARRDLFQHTHDTDEAAWRAGAALHYEMEIEVAGGCKVFDVSKIPLRNPDGSRRGLVVVGRDVTERQQTAERIQHLAHHDSLTGLPNRALFQERLRQALAQASRIGQRLGLMFLDLDKFKDVNDTLGHHIGDQLLSAVARRLSRCLRQTDTVARLGGDEFAVILTNLAEPEGAARVAETIRAAIAEPFALEGHEVATSTSIGITVFPDDAATPEELLKNADLAMFHSKSEGRNGYHFYVAAMDAEVQARKTVERDMRVALGTDQLALHYQPLIDMASGRIVGCEALLRWTHPTLGAIPPAQFIPIIERTDLIIPLGRWILHHACHQARAWHRAGLSPVQVAVNLSPAQFKNGGQLVATVAEILDQTGLPPGHLQLEITEGIAMHNIDATIEVLRALRTMGVSISIDDFGTGYSSLNYLKRFPIDKLKIDRSFIVDIDEHPDNAAVVKAIVDLGHSLGTRVNVEGVETADQLAFLRRHQVDEAQGYLFSRAIPAAQFADLVGRHAPWRFD